MHAFRSTLVPQLPARHELTDVPFYPQTKLHCGPAALATALLHEGFHSTPDQLSEAVYTPARKGSLPLDMLGGARRSGAVATELPNTLDSALSEVASGRPVIVLQNLGLSWYPVWHYAVLVGYDLDRSTVFLRSGTTARETQTLRTFMNTWSRSDRWAMIVMQPGAMSKQVDPLKYSAAVVALERLGHSVASRRAYEAGVERWSDNLVLRIGAGNMAYKGGDLAIAESHYRAATIAHPNSDAALNNLAQVLSDRGDIEGAIDAASRAVAINGPLSAAARETLSNLRAKSDNVTR